jgi:hypothetical protein
LTHRLPVDVALVADPAATYRAMPHNFAVIERLSGKQEKERVLF